MQLPDIADAAVSCLDLLLRWAVLRLCDANTQCLLKVLDLCKALFDVCQEMVSRHGSPQAWNLWLKSSHDLQLSACMSISCKLQAVRTAVHPGVQCATV